MMFMNNSTIKDKQPFTAFNRSVAVVLRDTADMLTGQGANPFRVDAYRRAAESLEALHIDLRVIVRFEGSDGLKRIPFVGQGLSVTIDEIVRTGRCVQLDRLRGAIRPETLFQTIPGIGPILARNIYDRLQVDTLEGLEIAAHNGRLERVAGIGARRSAAIRASLASVLGRHQPRVERRFCEPSVSMVLDVDREYREKAEFHVLPLIAPRRFNPKAEAWLPILHVDRESWHFTALYSNTARAHELGRTRDWVILYCYDGDHQESQHTVVTETRGPLAGRRVVRGRESECTRHYRQKK